jgi:hypothetical protein
MAGRQEPEIRQTTYSYRPDYNVRHILWSQTKIFDCAYSAWEKIDEVLADLEALSTGCLSFQRLFLQLKQPLLELKVSLGYIMCLSWMVRQ